MANYRVHHILKEIVIIKIFNVSKHNKSRIHFSKFKTLVYFNIQ